jgi:hypothetical protein
MEAFRCTFSRGRELELSIKDSDSPENAEEKRRQVAQHRERLERKRKELKISVEEVPRSYIPQIQRLLYLPTSLVS